jgi:hypothetical protein
MITTPVQGFVMPRLAEREIVVSMANIGSEAQRPRKQKRRLPEGKRRFCLIVTRKEELPCPWQAWQRPTLPGLKP